MVVAVGDGVLLGVRLGVRVFVGVKVSLGATTAAVGLTFPLSTESVVSIRGVFVGGSVAVAGRGVLVAGACNAWLSKPLIGVTPARVARTINPSVEIERASRFINLYNSM